MKLVTFEDYKTKVEEFEIFLGECYPSIPKGLSEFFETKSEYPSNQCDENFQIKFC